MRYLRSCRLKRERDIARRKAKLYETLFLVSAGYMIGKNVTITDQESASIKSLVKKILND